MAMEFDNLHQVCPNQTYISKGVRESKYCDEVFLTDHPSLPQFSSNQSLTLEPAVNQGRKVV